MKMREVARRTLQICESGQYAAPSGAVVHIDTEQRAAEANTRLYRPDELRMLIDSGGGTGPPPFMNVSAETTQAAGQRMAADGPVVLLNFASARNPGGGFLRGAKAQEEDVTRCSGLYPCLLNAPEYYSANRAQSSMMYTDHIIYSPAVPFFRIKSDTLIEQPFEASVITAPAPNAGEARRKGEGRKVSETLTRRAGMVLAIAQDNGHRRLLLGAWGCGVFQNNATEVATVFRDWLTSPRFAGAFDQVDFGIWDNTKDKRVLQAFQAVIEAPIL